MSYQNGNGYETRFRNIMRQDLGIQCIQYNDTYNKHFSHTVNYFFIDPYGVQGL